MTESLPPPPRRAALAWIASVPVFASGWRRAAGHTLHQALVDAATVMVAGPDGGTLDRWSRVLEQPLAQGLSPEALIRRDMVGGRDGVTGANQFHARIDPDDRTALLAPGDAVMAWLVGDPRAKYDVARWIPVAAALTPGIVLARPGTFSPARSLRVASAGFNSGDLTAILGQEMLGAKVTPIAAVAAQDRISALGQGTLDAVFLRGHHVADQAAALLAAGAVALFSVGPNDAQGRPGPIQAFPAVPTMTEALAAPAPSPLLLEAWEACAAASQLEFALVLQHLTPAARVALWRQAGAEVVASLEVQAAARNVGARMAGGLEATATAAAVTPGAAAMAMLRRWLVSRYDWKPV